MSLGKAAQVVSKTGKKVMKHPLVIVAGTMIMEKVVDDGYKVAKKKTAKCLKKLRNKLPW
jgi:hypothetical protein